MSETPIKYRLTIDSITNPDQLDDLAEYLSRVIRGMSPESARERLARLPYVISSNLSEKLGNQLREQLGKYSAIASLEPVMPGQESVAPPPPPPPPEPPREPESPAEDPAEDWMTPPDLGDSVEEDEPEPGYGRREPQPEVTITRTRREDGGSHGGAGGGEGPYSRRRREPESAEPEGVPWERREELGFWRALWETWKGSLFDGRKFYGNIRDEGIGNAVLYAAMMGLISTIPVAILLYVMIKVGSSLLFGMGGMEGMPPEAEMMMGQWTGVMQNFGGLIVFGMVIMSPFAALLGLLLASLVLHLGVLIVRGGGGYAATFNVAAYTSSIDVIQFVPNLGAFVALVVKIILATVGFSEKHKLSTGAGAFAALFPLLLLAVLGIFGAILFFMLIAAAASSAQG